MLRYLNALAIAALICSALYAYSIKYETIYFSEQIVKMKHEIAREKEAINVLHAEWAHLTRPERIQSLAEKHLELQPQSITQIVRPNDLPDRAQKIDTIGRKLEALGLAEPTATPINTTTNAGGATPAPSSQR